MISIKKRCDRSKRDEITLSSNNNNNITKSLHFLVKPLDSFKITHPPARGKMEVWSPGDPTVGIPRCPPLPEGKRHGDPKSQDSKRPTPWVCVVWAPY